MVEGSGVRESDNGWGGVESAGQETSAEQGAEISAEQGAEISAEQY
jgi:hypothetical protein